MGRVFADFPERRSFPDFVEQIDVHAFVGNTVLLKKRLGVLAIDTGAQRVNFDRFCHAYSTKFTSY